MTSDDSQTERLTGGEYGVGETATLRRFFRRAQDPLFLGSTSKAISPEPSKVPN
jgi:hypothetical protein